MDIKEVLNLKDGSVVKFTLIDIQYELFKEGDCYD